MTKWQGVLVLVLIGSPALAQGTPLVIPAPVSPSLTDNSAPLAHQDLFPGFAAQGESDPLTGNHNFRNFIGFISNPLQNIDPRAMTSVDPIFGSSWISNTPPIPNGDGQVYGPAITVALSDRFAMGMNQGGYAVANLSRNPVERQRLFLLDPLGRFRDVEIGGERQGWLNLGGFFQYTLIEDVENQFLLTGGLRWIAPCGS